MDTGYLGLAASSRPPPVTALASLVVGSIAGKLRILFAIIYGVWVGNHLYENLSLLWS